MVVFDKNYMMEELGIKFGWLDGEFLPWKDCKLHMYSQVSRYGFRTFEGIRAYWNEDNKELYVFRLDDHLNRLMESNKLMRITIPYTKDDIAKIVVEIFAKNEFQRDSYVQPSPYVGMGGISADASAFMGLMAAAVPIASSEGKDATQKACISSWRRLSDDSIPPRIKSGAQYTNLRLAQLYASAGGYDFSILLTNKGKVSEGSGTNLIMIRKGVPTTPTVTNDILEGITRATLAYLLKEEMGLTTIERDIDRTELYIAEEVLLCGTGSEILPIGSIDGLTIGDGREGPITKKLRELYFSIVRGKNPKYMHWLTPVYHR